MAIAIAEVSAPVASRPKTQRGIELGEELERLRRERAWSQKHLAERLEMSEEGYRNYAKGYGRITRDTLPRWAKAFEMTVADLASRLKIDLLAEPDASSLRQQVAALMPDADAAERARAWAQGDVEPAVLLLGHWLDRWLALRLPLIRPHTQVSYRRHIRACGALGFRPLAAVTTDELQLHVNGLLGRWTRNDVAVWRSVISSALKAAVPRHLAHNPMTGVKLPKPDEKPPKAWSAEEVSRLVEAVKGDHHEAWLWFAIGTGARLGELRALEWPDIDLRARTVTISKALDQTTDEVGPTKTGRVRVVDIPDEVIAMLVAQRARQAPGALCVFPSPVKATMPMRARSFAGWLARLCERARVRPLTTHSTRHTFATLALEAGEPLKEVSEALGHASVAITANTYSHVVDRRGRRVANALGAILTQPVAVPPVAIGTRNGTR